MELIVITKEVEFVLVATVENYEYYYELQIDNGKFNGIVVKCFCDDETEPRKIESRAEKQPIVLAALEQGLIEI